MIANAYEKYKRNSVETASPLMLIIMLYDGGVRFLRAAVAGLEEKDYSKWNENIKKTQNIITELTCCLDANQGGEIADNLQSIYNYCHSTLVQGNIQHDPEKIREVIVILQDLREAWAEINAQMRKDKLYNPSAISTT